MTTKEHAYSTSDVTIVAVYRQAALEAVEAQAEPVTAKAG